MRAMLAMQRLSFSAQRVFGLALVVGMLALPGLAFGGGVGVFNGTGLHFGQALGEDAEQGRWFNEGGGVEVVLGDRDARLKGRLRLAYNAIIDFDGGVRHSGILSIGATIGLLPEVTNRFGLYLVTDLGVSPLVKDMRVYFFADLGPGVRFDATERLTLFAELCGLFRYDTSFAGGLLLSLGVRLPFE